MRPTFDQTVNVLVQAYLNDTLEHGNCYACAVGNIIANANGYKYVPCVDQPDKTIAWDAADGRYNKPGFGSWYGFIRFGLDSQADFAIEEIRSSGYTKEELLKIEAAFETSARFDDDRMFKGLMAVVDVLSEIHEVSLEQKEEAKLLFV
jgi:hypothetical protein